MHILIWDIFFIFFISFIFSSEICFSALIEMRRAAVQQTTAPQCAHCAGSQQINRSKRFIGHLVWWILAFHFSFPFYSSTTDVMMTFLLLFLFTRPPRRSLPRQLSSTDLHQRRKPGEISNIFILILVECFFLDALASLKTMFKIQ